MKTQDSPAPVIPEWARLPKSGGICPYTSLRRSILNELVVPSKKNSFVAPVRSVLVKKPGCVHGFRLFHIPSAFAYLSKMADEQANNAANFQK